MTTHEPKPAPARWPQHLLFWVLLIVVCSGYGLLAYAVFHEFFSGHNNGDESFGVMMSAFLLGVPFSMSATIAYFLQLKKHYRFGRTVLIAYLPIATGIIASIFIFNEGSICIIMFFGMSLIPLLIGVMMGRWLARIRTRLSSSTFMSVFLTLPFLIGAAEQHYPLPDTTHELSRSVFIQAPAAVIWHHINYPTNIHPSELEDGLAYMIGVPYPIEARTITPAVGGKRKLTWQRGVTFEEEITQWDEHRFIEWVYLFDENSFPPGSLDDHVKIGGAYFDLLNTSYRLTPQQGGTQLDINVSFRVSTTFNWYAAPWAHLLLGDTAATILNFYKHRSENTPQTLLSSL